MSGAPSIPVAAIRWTAGLFLASAVAGSAATHEVDFSILMPEADRVHLVGSFNDWKISDDSLMTNDNGSWRKTVPLATGEHAYRFKAEGKRISGNGWRLDWKAPREKQGLRDSIDSVLVVPDDLEIFRARQRSARATPRDIEIPLFYDRYLQENYYSRPGGEANIPFRTNPPAGEWKLPSLSAEPPLFAQIPLGDSTYLAVLDRSSPTNRFYSRVYLDRNGNRDLTDDDPIDGESETYGRNYFHCSFPPVDLEIETGGRQLPYRFRMRIGGPWKGWRAAGQEDPDLLDGLDFAVSPQCAYLGEFSLDGAGYRIALGDSNANGIFGNPARLRHDMDLPDRRLFATGDELYVSTGDLVRYSDGLLLGDFLALGDRLFEVQVDVPGRRLLLKPLAESVGALEFPVSVESMTLLSAEGDRGFMLCRVGRRAPAPSGTWRLLGYQAHKIDEWGDTWFLRASGSEDTSSVTVTGNEPSPWAVGDPLQTFIDIPEELLRKTVANRSLRFNFGIRGNVREIIDEIRHVSGTQTKHAISKRSSNRPEEAAYRIVKPDGEKVASGSFEYG